MDNASDRQRLSFGGVAGCYERARPGYPDEAVRWLVGPGQARVLELGAGTGKLTSRLVAHGHRVLASEPSLPMLRQLRSSAWRVQSAAEAIPLRSSSVDVVAAAQAFHWFDHAAALPEIARVLRPDGVIALAWNYRDESVPWVRRLSDIIGGEPLGEGPVPSLVQSGLFGEVEHRSFRFWQPMDRPLLLDLVRSRSYVAVMTDAERSTLLEKVGQLYDDYGRGRDGMLMPYLTECFRARVTGLANFRRESSGGAGDGLLIDFS
jgi:SAM-dependent methyltransferase